MELFPRRRGARGPKTDKPPHPDLPDTHWCSLTRFLGTRELVSREFPGSATIGLGGAPQYLGFPALRQAATVATEVPVGLNMANPVGLAPVPLCPPYNIGLGPELSYRGGQSHI